MPPWLPSSLALHRALQRSNYFRAQAGHGFTDDADATRVIGDPRPRVKATVANVMEGGKTKTYRCTVTALATDEPTCPAG